MSLNSQEIAALLQPYVAGFPASECDLPRISGQLAQYLELLLKWNARMNLTAIREPEEIVRRHFGESLFTGLHLLCSTWNIPGSKANPASHAPSQQAPDSLLDFGSGAGFPGLPIQLLRPALPVTLAEARQKKTSFLREAVRSLELSAEVWSERVELMSADRQFSIVTLRAVDHMDEAIPAAAARARDLLAILGTRSSAGEVHPALASSFSSPESAAIPDGSDRALLVYRRILIR